jgi:hypothetical protein
MGFFCYSHLCTGTACTTTFQKLKVVKPGRVKCGGLYFFPFPNVLKFLFFFIDIQRMTQNTKKFSFLSPQRAFKIQEKPNKKFLITKFLPHKVPNNEIPNHKIPK